MKLKCVIVDDEPLAADLLRSYALQTPFLDVAGVYNSAIDALPRINEGGINLIFLDINMPKINGMEFSKTLPASIKIIFTTAYDQYAIEGFKVNALDYLLKPISYVDFLQASNRALDWFKVMNNISAESIFVKSGYQYKKLEYSNILYIENQKDYVRFFLEGQSEPVSSLMNIQQLAEKLPCHVFMRVHRSFIVNLDKVKTVERNCIVFGKTLIPVSDTYREQFNLFLNKGIL
ncbi:LytTR family DNA-binding domain-containing protein [Dysgonomonas sp. 511]|uniref:LytR/AlgR family response regulator transcription factor n=1 Tax=Dysgonomonas sp. 511 TaxID=2302930 RepID=UPI0013D270C3|nr:LytTR family DNA-binding domain-containing protein [Dysgonomonas sp. 511]NDV78601.1 DNA-binding response regulator [Dysgonomonas sp. 511]